MSTPLDETNAPDPEILHYIVTDAYDRSANLFVAQTPSGNLDPRTWEGLAEILRSKGFTVEVVPPGLLCEPYFVTFNRGRHDETRESYNPGFTVWRKVREG